MKAFEIRIDNELKDIIVESSLDQAIKTANQLYPYTTDDDLMEVVESPCTIGKDIQYCDECKMFMIQLGDKTYYPLYSYICSKPTPTNTYKNNKHFKCNTIKDTNDIRR